ncbi:hypothetical protein [Nocardioides deserti]|uniref:TPM domain-containing protein n=1 Tax=Nocardioides deserti TaxID=1588644 RepID=A0ABR6U960_9ACTN|nr:hypothetical protein [Nocardioides deserti]MBC2960981.1 hypothetical protein [Nocardioides deserti]GGO76003.1 hypothetical protein GCM10012276_27730 [Nocardioides deserti]
MKGLNRITCAVAAVVLGTGAALVVDARLDSSADREYAAGDRVLAAVEGLRDDHVHVTDDGRGMLAEADERAIAELIAERDLPAYVLVWKNSWFAGYDHYVQSAEQVLHQLGEPALLVLWQGPENSTTQVTPGWTVDRWTEGGGDAEVEPTYLGDAALRIPEWLEQLPEDPLVAQDDYYGGLGGGLAAGAFFAAPIVLGFWLLLGVVRVATSRRFRNRPLRAPDR